MSEVQRPSRASLALWRMARDSILERDLISLMDRPGLLELLQRILDAGLIQGAGPSDMEAALERLEGEFITRPGPLRIIEEDIGERQKWLPPPGPLRADLRRYLQTKHWTLGMLAGLDTETALILSRIGDPTTPGTWERAGLVVGQVQSGKTTSYTSLIAGALESGYRAVVILTGRTDDLRDQTQRRIDEGILGRRSSFIPQQAANGSEPVGVGVIRREAGLPDWPLENALLQLTSRDELSGAAKGGGDFNLPRARANNVVIGTGGTVPLMLAVIKKNTTVLKNLVAWFQEAPERLAGGAMLVIDDEADDASIDIAAGENPSATNREIRRLLACAERSVYVGYTATPYANLLINPDTEHERHGRDIFPRDFVALLDPPATYMGPREFLNPQPGRRHHVEITDAVGWIEQHALHGPLPRSLVWAVQEFIVATAIRAVRTSRMLEDRGHASMLVHCNVRTNVQRDIANELLNLLEQFKAGWEFPVPGGTHDALERAWERLDEHQDQDVRVTWEEISQPQDNLPEGQIGRVLEKIEVKQVNSDRGGGRLEYGREERTVVAVGGYKLSRGLTLEGLTTSYQLRETDTHDTLMQMGRWFGYRPGYADLCQVHTTGALLEAFRMLLDSDEELRLDLLELQEQGASPQQVALSISQPEGMRVTARPKSRQALVVRGSGTARTHELTWFPAARAQDNERNADQQLRLLGEPVHLTVNDRPMNRLAWDNVPVSWVLDTLNGHVEPDPQGRMLRPSKRAVYAIEEAVRKGELETWRVVLVAGTLPEEGAEEQALTTTIAGHQCRRFQRQSSGTEDIRFDVVSQPVDERFGVGATYHSSGNRNLMKASRDMNVGLLLGYPLITTDESGKPHHTFSWAVSFPRASTGTRVLGKRAQQEAGLQ